jgi:class 3 adenylate cyclase
MFRTLSIRSRLMLMLLTCGLGCMLAVGAFLSRSTQRELVRAADQQMITLRELRAEELHRFFAIKVDAFRVLAQSPLLGESVGLFAAALAALDGPLTEAETAALHAWYRRDYLTPLARFSEGTPTLEAYLPRQDRLRRLQYQYIARDALPEGKRPLVDTAGTATAYDRLHQRLQPSLRASARMIGFDDIMVVDAETGVILFSVTKQADFGTSLRSGPYQRSGAARAFDAALQLRDVGALALEDFSPYAPSLMRPTAFMAVPIYVDGEPVAVLIGQFSAGVIDALMSSAGDWERLGLGKTGEAVLIGPDGTLRSSPRAFREDPEAYIATLRQQRMPADTIRRIQAYGSPVMLQATHSQASEAVRHGETGDGTYVDYRGKETIGAWRPLALPGLSWSIIAKMDEEEALAPAMRTRRVFLVVVACAVVALTLVSILLAASFARRLREVLDAMDRLAGGDDAARVAVLGRDEFSDLGRGFNRMASEIADRSAALAAKTGEYETLLRNVYPEAVAERLRLGETQIVESLHDVTLVALAIDGLDAVPPAAGQGFALDRLTELMDTLDEAAARHGIEKIKTLGDVYIAACGISVPRLDHAHRALAFVEEAASIVARFKGAWGDDLTLRAAIASGAIEAGLIGRQRRVYDVWGPNFAIMRHLLQNSPPGEVRMTAAAHALLPPHSGFVAAPPIEVPGTGRVEYWRGPAEPAETAAA